MSRITAGHLETSSSRCFRGLIQTPPAADEDVRIRSFAYFAFVMRRVAPRRAEGIAPDDFPRPSRSALALGPASRQIDSRQVRVIHGSERCYRVDYPAPRTPPQTASSYQTETFGASSIRCSAGFWDFSKNLFKSCKTDYLN